MTKVAWGTVSLFLTVVAYAAYLWQTVYQKEIQPHPVSWFLFALATTVAWEAQKVRGALAGMWTTELTAVVCFVICVFSLVKFIHRYRRLAYMSFEPDQRLRYKSNVMSLILSVTALFLFRLANTPEGAAFFATAADVAAYWPTLEKAKRLPFNDSTTSFGLNSAKFIPALFAMGSYSFATCLYPATLVLMNAYVTSLLMRGRKRDAFPGKPWSLKIAWQCYKREWGSRLSNSAG